MDRRRGSIEKATSEGTRRVKWWRGQCRQRRMASMAEGDEGMKVGDMDPPKEDLAPDQRQQRLRRWGTATQTEAGVAAGKQGDEQWCQPV